MIAININKPFLLMSFFKCPCTYPNPNDSTEETYRARMKGSVGKNDTDMLAAVAKKPTNRFKTANSPTLTTFKSLSKCKPQN